MIYKRRRRTRRRTRVYKRRYSRKRSMQKRIEVKSVRTGNLDQSVRTYKYSTPTTLLDNSFSFQEDILKIIEKGVNQYDRIGQQIFVKKIIYKFWGEICPKFIDTPTTNVQCNTSWIRYIIDNQRTTANIAGYFRGPTHLIATGDPDRRAVQVHRDVTRNVTAGFPAQWTNSGAVVGVGACFHHKIVIPVNRTVTYDPNTGRPRNDRDVFSLRMLGYMPNIPAQNALQTHCVSFRVYIYYTDD